MIKLTVFIALCFSTLSYAQMGRIVGQLGMAEGEVFIDQKPAKKHAPLREGATVEVKNGKATLLLGKGSVFHLAPNSKMVVSQFGVDAETNKEKATVDLRFGRTRALIQSKGVESQSNVMIKARGATMGVRGTEVFVNVPDNPNIPAQFFTLEGLAQIERPQAPPVEVKQNQGFDASQGVTANEIKIEPSKRDIGEVSSSIKTERMHANEIKTPTAIKRMNGEFISQPSLNVPFPNFDPIQDAHVLLNVSATYCNPVSGQCNP